MGIDGSRPRITENRRLTKKQLTSKNLETQFQLTAYTTGYSGSDTQLARQWQQRNTTSINSHEHYHELQTILGIQHNNCIFLPYSHRLSGECENSQPYSALIPTETY